MKPKNPQDLFGEIESAYVTLRAYVKELRTTSDTRYSIGGEISEQITLDNPSATVETLDSRALVVHLSSLMEEPYWTCAGGTSNGYEISHCLIVVPDDDETGRYRRVGYLLRRSRWYGNRNIYTPNMEAMGTPRSWGPSWEERDLPGELSRWKRRSITIV